MSDTHPQHTQCCIVGAGPAGAMLALLLARKGVNVTLLEAHRDFDRPFRGNTLNPAVLQIMEQLGLRERLLQLRHTKITRFVVQTDAGPVTFADFGRLPTSAPYVMMLPQAHFLKFLLSEAQRYPNFRLVLGARVEQLIEEGGVVHGVRYRTGDDWHDLHATLTVGADGRFSRLRRLAALETISSAAPIDVLWFMLPRAPHDPHDAGAIFRFGKQSLLVLMDHFDHWQVGYIMAKGSYPELKARGIEAFRRSICDMAPELADRVAHIDDWRQCSLLSVASDRLRRWYKPGLILIGDAAHTMSPVGGVGINMAIQDAVVAANLLTASLQKDHVDTATLAEVQRRREWPTRVIQACQSFLQRRVVTQAFASTEPFKLSPLLRLGLCLPLLRMVPSWLIAFGASRVRGMKGEG
jgi:2-polyprenyl-6-methoxyphenol hydroxylase-like FAD-dependent oxidoreductase